MFLYGVAQNKGNAKAIQATINCIVPYAFDDHKNCDNKWCRSCEIQLHIYKHHDLPYGKDMSGDKLRSALENIFSDYCTDGVADKLTPMTNSQRNKPLNSVVGSKNKKLRFAIAAVLFRGWRVAGGGRRVTGDRWRLTGGGWQVAGDRWRVNNKSGNQNQKRK